MLFDPKHGRGLGGLEDQLRRAQAITPELINDVIAQAGVRFAAQEAGKKSKVNRLIESGAWTDAILALAELELPQWKLRRLVYEDGEWLCSLSRQPQLPLGLDELVEARHEIMPLAILIAIVQARRSAAVSAVAVTAVPRLRPASSSVVCCDNFA